MAKSRLANFVTGIQNFSHVPMSMHLLVHRLTDKRTREMEDSEPDLLTLDFWHPKAKATTPEAKAILACLKVLVRMLAKHRSQTMYRPCLSRLFIAMVSIVMLCLDRLMTRSCRTRERVWGAGAVRGS